MTDTCLFKKDFIYLFLDRGEGRERERESNINVWLPLTQPLLGTWPATQACALTRNRTGNVSVRRPVLNALSHTSQGCPFFLNKCIELQKALDRRELWAGVSTTRAPPTIRRTGSVESWRRSKQAGTASHTVLPPPDSVGCRH